MEKIIGKNVFEIQDEVYMRQMVEIGKLNKKLDNWEITQDELIVEMIVIMLRKINNNEDRKIFSDFILDNLTPIDFWCLSDLVSEIVYKFLKKNETTDTNTKSSWINEVENSVTNGKKS